MKRSQPVALVAVCVLLVLALGLPMAMSASAPTAAPSSAPSVSVPLSSKLVMDWTADDVAEWMTTVVGYAEYTPYLLKNLVDGVTLLEMEPADFESYLPLRTPLHAIKIGAHLKLLKGLCSCRAAEAETAATGPSDLWAYMRQHPVRTWVLGSTASYFPRIALVATYLFDRDVYNQLVQVERPASSALAEAAAMPAEGQEVPLRQVSYLSAAAYWVGGLLCPDLYLAYQSARFVGRNYIMMPLQVIHFLSRALGEGFILFLIYKQEAFPADTPLWKKFWIIHSYSIFIPPACVLIGYVFPTFLQYICAVVFVAHNVFYLVLSLFLGQTELGQPMTDRQQKEADEAVRAAYEQAAAAHAAAAGSGGAEEEDKKEKVEKLD